MSITRYALHAIVQFISANPPTIHRRIAERRRQVKARQAAQRAVDQAGQGALHPGATLPALTPRSTEPEAGHGNSTRTRFNRTRRAHDLPNLRMAHRPVAIDWKHRHATGLPDRTTSRPVESAERPGVWLNTCASSPADSVTGVITSAAGKRVVTIDNASAALITRCSRGMSGGLLLIAEQIRPQLSARHAGGLLDGAAIDVRHFVVALRQPPTHGLLRALPAQLFADGSRKRSLPTGNADRPLQGGFVQGVFTGHGPDNTSQLVLRQQACLYCTAQVRL